MLRRIDEFVDDQAMEDEVGPVTRPEPTRLGEAPTELDLTRFRTVVWATGYRPRFSWLPPEALDRRGRLAHVGGVASPPGLYVLGLPFLRRRRSNLISGLGLDAGELCGHLRAHLDERTRRRMTLLSS